MSSLQEALGLFFVNKFKFNIDVFRHYLKEANPNYKMYSEHSLMLLEIYLEGAGPRPALGSNEWAQIKKLAAFVPYYKQQKYIEAFNYLKNCVPDIADAIPVSPKMKYCEFAALCDNNKYPMRFYHKFELSWKSSNGNMTSLNKVSTRENVKHQSDPHGPPFNTKYTKNIPWNFVHGAGKDGANSGINYDEHSIGNPSLIVNQENGAVDGKLIAYQDYEYTTNGGATWTTIPGAQYVLTKGVRSSGDKKVFYFSKKNREGTPTTPFHFEVEYPINPPPEWQPKNSDGEKLFAGFSFSAARPTMPVGKSLVDYAKLISPGY